MRTAKFKRQPIKADAKYNSETLQKFINHVMLHGKKALAERVVYTALASAAEKVGSDPLTVFEQAVRNVAPTIEVRARRVGGATYQIPMPVRTERKEMLAMRWIIQAARSRKGTDMSALLADELVSAYNEEGEAMKIKQNVHKMAEANRAFAHFKW
jgi:small subunit ribosomal protein S7